MSFFDLFANYVNEDQIQMVNLFVLQDPAQRKKRRDEFKENLGQSLTNQKKKNHLRNLFFCF